MTNSNSNTTYTVVCSNGYNTTVVYVGDLKDCNLWLSNYTVPVTFGLNTFNCLPDDSSDNGYDSNGDGNPNYYSIQPF